MERNYLAALIAGLTLLALALVGAMALPGAVGADTGGETSADQSITVDATGEATVAPDQAVVELAVTDEGDDPQEIRDELALGAEQLEDKLDELGVDYETSHYSISEPYRSDQDEPDYRGAHVFTVTLNDPDDVGDVVDAGANVGAEIGNVEMTLSDEERDELRDEAIESAMSDARHQAEMIAESGDMQVTGVVSVDASQSSYRTVSLDTAPVPEATDHAVAAPPTDIDMGDVSVTYDVHVTFEAES